MPYVEETEQAPRLRLNGRAFEIVERDWSSSHRRDVNRQRKRLAAEKGPVSLWTPQTVEEAEPVLTEFFKVHDGKWLSQGYPGMFTEEKQRHFRAILHRLFGHTLHFSTVRCDGIDVSYLIGFFAGGWLQYYRPSYRPEFGVYSPSKIHIGMLVEEACRQNWAGVDFLLGGYSYKYAWANETNEVTSIHAGFHKLAPSYLWFSQGKPYVRDRLGNDYLRAKGWLENLVRKNKQ
jgi:CelD/BcsL family acetyltransferase involved in cellulose biosynthesis